jgi:hypothetical protein
MKLQVLMILMEYSEPTKSDMATLSEKNKSSLKIHSQAVMKIDLN